MQGILVWGDEQEVREEYSYKYGKTIKVPLRNAEDHHPKY